MNAKATPEGKASRIHLITSLLTIILALISLIVLKVHAGGFWIYTQILCVVIAIIYILEQLYLSFALKIEQHISVLRYIVYWVGFLAAIYLIAVMLNYGVTGAVQSGLFALVLLATTLFFNGILDRLSTALVGITVGLMTTGAIVVQAYLLLVIIPLAIIMGFLIFVLIQKNKKA